MMASRGVAVLALAVGGLVPGTAQAVQAVGALSPLPAVAPAAARATTSVSGWPSTLPSALPRGRVAVTVRLVSRAGVGGRLVVVQRYRVAGRTWVPVVRVRTSPTGRVALRWTAPATPGSVRYRVSVGSTARATAVTTRPAVLRVAPAASTISAQLVRAVNVARSHPRTCGTKAYPAVAPVAANSTLTKVAEAFARRMGVEAFFDHTSPSGDGPGDRISAAGYRWSAFGEDIAAGQPTAARVMADWLASPGHCAIIMGSGFAEIGAGHAAVPGSPYRTYWVLDLGRR